MSAININKLSKSFKDNKVLKELTMNIPEGSIYGFVGENGAGKSTTMKIILGLLDSNGGEITVFDEKVIFGQTPTNKYIGYLPDVPQFYDYLSAREYLKLCAEITSIDRSLISDRINEVLKSVNLKDTKKSIGGYSRGMKQRLGLAQALLNKPKILICDEPTSALDPIGRKEILDILLSIKGETTVLFSTHILSDVERICDYIGVLHKGSLVLDGEIITLKEEYSSNKLVITLKTEDDFKKLIDILSEQFFTTTDITDKEIVVADCTDKDELVILKLLAENEILPSSINSMDATLEDIFYEVTK